MEKKIPFVAVVTIVTLMTLQVALSLPWIPQHGDQNWMKHHQQFLNVTETKGTEIQVVFLGASIVEYWLYNGLKIWQQHYEPRHAFNYGIGGDRTENVLWRIDNGEFDKLMPKLFVIMVGNNNISAKDKPEAVSKGLKEIVKQLRNKCAKSKLLLLAALPRSGNIDRQEHRLNELMSQLADNQTTYYLDMKQEYESDIGVQRPGLFVPDGIHLTPKGYEVWYETMEPEFVKLIA